MSINARALHTSAAREVSREARARNNQIRWKIDIPPPAKIEGVSGERGGGRGEFRSENFCGENSIRTNGSSRVESSLDFRSDGCTHESEILDSWQLVVADRYYAGSGVNASYLRPICRYIYVYIYTYESSSSTGSTERIIRANSLTWSLNLAVAYVRS